MFARIPTCVQPRVRASCANRGVQGNGVQQTCQRRCVALLLCHTAFALLLCLNRVVVVQTPCITLSRCLTFTVFCSILCLNIVLFHCCVSILFCFTVVSHYRFVSLLCLNIVLFQYCVSISSCFTVVSHYRFVSLLCLNIVLFHCCVSILFCFTVVSQ